MHKSALQERQCNPIHTRSSWLLSYLTFLFFGAFTAAIGPTLGELSQQTGSSVAAIGGVITFLFLGSVVAQLAGGPLNDRLGTKPVLVSLDGHPGRWHPGLHQRPQPAVDVRAWR